MRHRCGIFPVIALAVAGCASVIVSACDEGGAPGPAAPSSSASIRPEERWAEVTSEVAPLLQSATDELAPALASRRGELLRVGKSAVATTWKGEIEGARLEREGMLFEVQRTADGSALFAFQADLGGEVSISRTDALCDALAKRAPFELTACKTSLRRARAADGAIVSYAPCANGPCPVAIERGGELGAIALQNMTVAHFFAGKKKSVLVAETRFVKAEGKRTSGSVVVVTLDGAEPVRAADYAADEVDATNPEHIVSKVVAITVTRSEIRLRGKLEEHGPGGAVQSSKPIDETHALPPLD